MTEHLWWYAVRASGLVAWALVTASVIWGLLLSSRATSRPRPAWVLDLHRFLGALGLAFLAVHLVGLTFDEWIGFGLADLLVPMASDYRPGALAWGIVALHLLVVVEVSSLLVRHLPRRLWHGIHLTSFVVFGATTVHVLTAGTDADRLPTQVFAGASSIAVVLLTAQRVVLGVRAARRRRARLLALAAHELGPRPDLADLDAALDDLHDHARRRRAVARQGHHRPGESRATPR